MLSLGAHEVTELRAGDEFVVFHRPLRVVLWLHGLIFDCDVAGLVKGRGAIPEEAVANAITWIRRETLRLSTSLTHTLEREDVERKQQLLGAVDLIRSKLLPEVDAETSIFGQLVRDGEKWMFTQFCSQGLVFEVPPSFVPAATPSGAHCWVRVKTGDAGEPTGEILRMELIRRAPLDAEGLLREWRRMMRSSENKGS